MILTKSLGFKTIVPTTKTSNNSDNDISNIWKNLLISYYSYRILNRLGVCYYTLYIHAIIINTTDKEYIVGLHERVGQLVILPVIIADFVEELGDERGSGAFNSTGK